MIRADPRLRDKRVLVVEDEVPVALLIEQILAELGCSVLGPYDSVAKALRAALMEGFDLALLDIDVAGERVFPVADALAARQIPFLFLSGSGDAAIPQGHAKSQVCRKPFEGGGLADALSSLLGDAQP
jgi:CheY-like chemotaxis protein